MKKDILQKVLTIVLLSFTLNINSQNWASLNGGANNYIHCIYGDTIHNILYAIGDFTNIGGVNANRIAKWNGGAWYPVGNGLPNRTSSQRAFTLYNNELVCTNTIFSPSDIHVGKLNGLQWDSIGVNFKGGFRGVITLNNELYVYGTFDTINHIYYNSIAKWDGQNWISLGFPYKFTGSTPDIGCLAMYNNELYAGGGFSDDSYQMVNIAKYDGNTWSIVGGGFHGSMDQVVDLEIYKGELYAAGLFNMNDGNAHNYIARWNGTEWNDVGGGVTSSGNGQIHDLLVLNDKLYAAGVFTEIGGIPAARIAAWDGTNWCSLGNTPASSSTIHCLATINHDLYIACGNIFDGNTVNHIAKWIGGNYVDTCGNTTGINELSNDIDELTVYPNPSSDNIYIEGTLSSSPIKLIVYDILGREVYAEKLQANTPVKKVIDVSGWGAGVYVVQLISNQSAISKKFIKQ